jgi:hypothetical protein
MTRADSLLAFGYAIVWRGGVRLRAPSSVQRALFTDIYRNNRWQDGESVSGPGSTRVRAAAFASELRQLFAALRVRVLLDAPCGDFNWMNAIAGDVESYIGVDIVEELVRRNDERFGSSRCRFLSCDFTHDPLPQADLILCRDALVHMSFADIRGALENFRRSGSRYLLTTTFIDIPSNRDERTGGWRTLNLEASPFGFPPPLAMVDEKCPRSGGEGKRLALWEIASILRS